MDFHIPNMTCSGCLRSVTRAIQATAPQAVVAGDPAARRITLTGQFDPSAVKLALVQAGFPPSTPDAAV